MRKALLAAVAAATLVVSLAACSAPEEDSATEGAETVTITHQFGSTEITGVPQNVVVLNSVWSDTLIKLDVPIDVEFLDETYGGDEHKLEWTPDHESTVIAKAPQSVPSVAELAAHDPDIILAGWLPDQESYDRLEQVAPTIANISSNMGDTWQDLLTTGGKIFDREDEAAAAIDEVNGEIESVKQEYALVDKTFAFTLFADGQLALVTGESDPSTQLFQALGLTIYPPVRELSESGERTFVSPERIEVLEADMVVAWPRGGGIELFEGLPGWAQLPAVQSGAVTVVDDEAALALGAPSVYSVPWMLEKLRPALANVA